MKVIIDGTMYHDAPWGGGFTYLNELIPRLTRAPGIEMTVEMARTAAVPPALSGLPAVKKEVLPRAPWFPAGRAKRFLGSCRRWTESRLWYARFFPVQRAVYHSASYVVPPIGGLHAVFTFHDLIAELFPEAMNEPFHDAVRQRKLDCVRRASHFIAISQQTKQDLCRFFGVSPERVSVVHHGINHELFAHEASADEIAAVKAKFGIAAPYVLYVGGRRHHKNFDRFAEAYATSAIRRDYRMLVVGMDWEDAEKARLAKLGIADRVTLARLPSHPELSLLYRFASFFVYPSLYEGFGLPLLEAMASGAPVATSDRSCLPEIAGEAAHYFNPEDVGAIARAMEAMTDTGRAEQLRAAGYRRVKSFSWDRAAAQTLEAYRRSLET